MDITLKGNNGEKVVIPIEDLIQKYWSDENSKPNRIEMSAKVKDETILAAMTICDEKEENYLSVDLKSPRVKTSISCLPPLRNSLTNRSATPISERVWRKPRTAM